MNGSDRVTRIFLEACALPHEERPAFLDASCEGDSTLRSEVEALLAADARAEAGTGTDGLAARVGRAAAAARASYHPEHPEWIGPYRIFEVLGEGGMGIVYRAEQTEPVRREVALKLVRGVIDSAAAVSRFELERQALAMMDHPNVARLYDAGTTGDGRPYFVMELVRGVPITEYCRERALAWRQRIELFLGVCRGVRHAHRRGVIHRDLKPSNILVTEEEAVVVPKVIDFSIAKALGEPGLSTEFRTRTGQVIGTLEYMSPEQAAGRAGAVDTRSDVYALGVVLHELVTGRLPYDLAGQPLHEAVRRIVEEPARPLRGTKATASGRFDDDLATIVGKCLEKEPDRRYGGAADLVEDLERYLGSRPIHARPPSTLYQMRKLVGRHRALFGFMTAALVLLLASTITVSIQLDIQRRERARAEAEARKAQKINSFLQAMLAAADPGKDGGRVSIRQVLDKAAGGMEKGLEDQPEIMAELHRTVGLAYDALGVTGPAKAHLERSLAVCITHYGEDHPETALARMLHARNLKGTDLVASEEQARLALAIFRRHHPGDHQDVFRALYTLSDILYQRGKLEESLTVGEEALAMVQHLPDAADDTRADALYLLGATLTDLGRWQEGEADLRQAASIMKADQGEHAMRHLDVLSDLEYNLSVQGRFDESIALNREVLAGRIALLGKDHPMVAVSESGLATLLAGMGRSALAEVHAREALRIWRQAEGEDSMNVALGWNNLGNARRHLGDHRGSLQALEPALRIAERHPANAATLRPAIYANIGIARERLGDLKEADTWLQRFLDSMQERWGKDSPELWGPRYERGCLRLEQGRPEEAESDLREALRLLGAHLIQRGRPPEPDPDYGLIINGLGRCLAVQGRVPEAETSLAQARNTLLTSVTSVDARRHELTRTAEIYDRLHRPTEAALYRGALARLEAFTRVTTPDEGPPAAEAPASPGAGQ